MLAIKNNIMASNAARHLGRAYDNLSRSVERLASGLRINSAKDDAAGLAVRELLRADIAVLQQGSRNAQDGISMLQMMEGAMQVMDDNLIRMQELAEQAATGSYSSAQRVIMNAEFAEMADEIDRIAGATKFNEINMLNASTGTVSIHVGTTTTIDIDKVNMTKAGLGINTGVEVYEAIFSPQLTSTTSTTTSGTFVTVTTDDTVTLTIQFDDDGTTEDTISIDLTAGTHTIAQLVTLINNESLALGISPTGVDKSYSMASVVDNTDGTFSLKVSSRDEADGVSIVVSSTSTTGDFDLAGTSDRAIVNAGTTSTVGILSTDATDSHFTADQVEGGVHITTTTAAAAALLTVTAAINTKDSARASFGYKMNRLESTIAILDVQSENLMSAESRISDVDVATEMATLTRNQVLAQAGISMLAQANAMPQMALTLLR